jgi:hypothetical protein
MRQGPRWGVQVYSSRGISLAEEQECEAHAEHMINEILAEGLNKVDGS